MLDWVTHWGYLGLFVVLFAEEAGVPLPIPGDMFIAAMGAAGRAGSAAFLTAAIVVVASSMSGSALLFTISRRVGEPLLSRVGRRFGFDADRADKVEAWLHRRGPFAVIVGRLTPGLRIVITVAAGALRMSRAKFLGGTAIASVIWAALYYWLGYFLGAGVAGALRAALGRAIHDPDRLGALITAAALGAIGALGVVVWRRTRARRRRARAADSATGVGGGTVEISL
ncbi:MAG TPA: DedA family protein [Gemmatimonadaceae bacterium]|nr:DedA family protein [Gemmatimonadaceae bacterium]